MITQERLKEVLDYDQDTGKFRRRTSGPGRSNGFEAGCINPEGYRQISIGGRSYKAHRLAILYTDGYMPENQIDHINRDRADNRRVNLREASHQCQARNSKMRMDNTSGIKGVYWHKIAGKWQVQIAVERHENSLGYYDDILEAAYTRYAAEQCLGFQDCEITSSAKQYIDSVKEV